LSVPSADVVVIGAGLAGLSAAIAAAESGARVHVLAKGHAATHWGPGGIDVAGMAAASTPRDGVRLLAGEAGHPYAFLGADVAAALDWIRPHLAAGGVEYVGDLDTPLQLAPTSIGGTRRAAILPAGQAAALSPWAAGERLVICGIAGFKDFWPEAIAASLSRARVWDGGNRPASVTPISVVLPGLAGRHNLNALEIARRFDDPAWRASAIEAMARAIAAVPGSGGRVAVPAVLGIRDHAAVLEAIRGKIPAATFEMPLVPPSVPGMRLYAALRAALIRAGGRVQIGEMIERIDRDGHAVTAVVSAAAARTYTVRAGALVLATGGIAGGGLVAERDGRLLEPLLGLPVEAPAANHWLAVDAFEPAGHPLEKAGIRTDAQLRPVDADGAPVFENVRVAGSLLAGQRYIRERCGDGVALASGWRAARSLSAVPAGRAAAPGSERP
jgi:glycerol-3-phosphate dehydrogenase subunit B